MKLSLEVMAEGIDRPEADNKRDVFQGHDGFFKQLASTRQPLLYKPFRWRGAGCRLEAANERAAAHQGLCSHVID